MTKLLESVTTYFLPFQLFPRPHCKQANIDSVPDMFFTAAIVFHFLHGFFSYKALKAIQPAANTQHKILQNRFFSFHSVIN